MTEEDGMEIKGQMVPEKDVPPAQDAQTLLIRGMLRSGAFEVRVTGEIVGRDIGMIIKLLQAQMVILCDGDERRADSAGALWEANAFPYVTR